jgi:predicted transcriptional regulator
MNNIDWFRVVIDLNEKYLACSDIAHYIGVTQPTIGNYKTTSSPRGKTAEKLIGLWSRKTGKPISEAPLRRWHENT